MRRINCVRAEVGCSRTAISPLQEELMCTRMKDGRLLRKTFIYVEVIAVI